LPVINKFIVIINHNAYIQHKVSATATPTDKRKPNNGSCLENCTSKTHSVKAARHTWRDIFGPPYTLGHKLSCW